MTILQRAMVCAAVAVFMVSDSEAARRRVVTHPGPPMNVNYTEGGYANLTSVAQGSAIEFHIATSVSPFNLRIVNLADPDDSLRVLPNLQSMAQDCSGQFTQGCDWAVTTTFDVPTSWRSGYYAAVFPTSLGERHVPFIVRENNPGSTSSVVIVSPTHTAQAYNGFGGRSLHPSSDPERATLISYDRPFDTESGLGRFLAFEAHLVRWMTEENRRFEVISDVDLEAPTALSPYDVVVIPGHSAYWTAAARANLETFHASGGDIAVLGGNTMWWQIRLENGARTIVSYKGLPYDPALESGSPLASTHFFSPPVNNPENRLLATSFRNGGYSNRVDGSNQDQAVIEMKPIEQRTPFTVTDGSHWIFDGTGLRNGDTFGQDVAGLEVDGVVFNCDSFGRILGPEGSDQAPLHYEILAVTPASQGWGTLGLVVNQAGAGLFNAATTGWVWGLASSGPVRTITANVLDRFRNGGPLPYRPVTSTILVQDLFNCAQPIGATGWRSSAVRPAVTSTCAYEGPAGLELAGADGLAIGRDLAPFGQSHGKIDIRFYIKADELQQRTTFPMPIVTLERRDGNTTRQVVQIELDATSGKRIRIARRSSSGEFAGASEWATLTSGWHLVEATWRSPGAITLQVDGGSVLTLSNPDSGQTVNGIVVGFPKGEATTAGRVCIDALAAGTEKPPNVPALR